MRIIECPAAYRRQMEERIETALAEIARDVDRRTDDDARIRALATVPDAMIDAGRPGTFRIWLSTTAEQVTAQPTNGTTTAPIAPTALAPLTH
jgi:hypothetical protein